MTVQELISILREANPDALVVFTPVYEERLAGEHFKITGMVYCDNLVELTDEELE